MTARRASAPPRLALVPATCLRLYVLRGVWMCETQAPAAAVDQVRSLFGTSTVPTAFLAATPCDVLAARIGALNPAAVLTVEHDVMRCSYPPRGARS